MSRSILAVAALAAAIAVPQAPAVSQDDAITVTGPTQRNAGEPANGVQQRTRIAADVSVYYADLDLRSEYGRWVLDQRLRLAADAACDQIDEIDPANALDPGDCRSLAMRRAEPEMRRAVRAAG